MKVMPKSAPRVLHQSRFLVWPLLSNVISRALLYIQAGTLGRVELPANLYDQLTPEQQTFFFVDASTPLEWEDDSAFYTAVSGEGWFNDENVMGTLVEGVAVYDKSSSRNQLNRGLLWFGLDPVINTFGPNWDDFSTWDDNAIWVE